MKIFVLAALVVLGAGGSLAWAQSVEAPAGTPPAAAVAPPTAAGTPVVTDNGTAPAPRPNDPNTTGPEKVNGLDVPKMKDGQSGRDQ